MWGHIKVANTVQFSIVSSLDYCNYLFTGMSGLNLERLHKVQNTWTRVVARQQTFYHIENVSVRDTLWIFIWYPEPTNDPSGTPSLRMTLHRTRRVTNVIYLHTYGVKLSQWRRSMGNININKRRVTPFCARSSRFRDKRINIWNILPWKRPRSWRKQFTITSFIGKISKSINIIFFFFIFTKVWPVLTTVRDTHRKTRQWNGQALCG